MSYSKFLSLIPHFSHTFSGSLFKLLSISLARLITSWTAFCSQFSSIFHSSSVFLSLIVPCYIDSFFMHFPYHSLLSLFLIDIFTCSLFSVSLSLCIFCKRRFHVCAWGMFVPFCEIISCVRGCVVACNFVSGCESDLQGGYTALMRAATQGHADCTRLLIDAGADKDATSNVRRRSLIWLSAFSFYSPFLFHFSSTLPLISLFSWLREILSISKYNMIC